MIVEWTHFIFKFGILTILSWLSFSCSELKAQHHDAGMVATDARQPNVSNRNTAQPLRNMGVWYFRTEPSDEFKEASVYKLEVRNNKKRQVISKTGLAKRGKGLWLELRVPASVELSKKGLVTLRAVLCDVKNPSRCLPSVQSFKIDNLSQISIVREFKLGRVLK